MNTYILRGMYVHTNVLRSANASAPPFVVGGLVRCWVRPHRCGALRARSPFRGPHSVVLPAHRSASTLEGGRYRTILLLPQGAATAGSASLRERRISWCNCVEHQEAFCSSGEEKNSSSQSAERQGVPQRTSPRGAALSAASLALADLGLPTAAVAARAQAPGSTRAVAQVQPRARPPAPRRRCPSQVAQPHG